MNGLTQLEDAAEAAWREYNAVQRALPDCPHVREWKQRIEAARVAHQAAIRACDRARSEDEIAAAAEPVPAASEPVPEPAMECQEALFAVGEAA